MAAPDGRPLRAFRGVPAIHELQLTPCWRIDADAIDRVVRKYAAALELDRGYSAPSMRATFITTALENGAQPEDIQKAAGHRDPSTISCNRLAVATKLDR
jgi:integrase